MRLFSPSLFTAVLLLGSTSAQNTTIDEQFCQVYYNLDDGNCETLRNAVRSEIRGSGTPTLELGNPSEKPVLVFFHGWPDTHAMWANQFAAFCGEGGEFACVAPSMMDHNPDVAPADPASLRWPLQADILHEVIVDMGLQSITLVMHDFGVAIGSMYIARHPGVVQRAVLMDVGNSPGLHPLLGNPSFDNLPFFFPTQQGAIAAFMAENDTAMEGVMQGMTQVPGFAPPPCVNCKIAPDTEVGNVGYKTGWIHFNFVNDEPAWTSFFDTPYSEFEFNFSPTWPDNVPQLFLYGTEGWHDPSLRTWLDNRGDGSGHRRIGDDHWFMCRVTVTETNEAMAAFFEGRPSPTPSMSPSPSPTPTMSMSPTPTPTPTMSPSPTPNTTTTTSMSAEFGSTETGASSRANGLLNSMILAKAVCALSIAKIFF